MELRQLDAFLAVIDQGSFSAAAEALFTVQSNISSHVARLESELGVTLLDRRTRDLTPAGLAVEARGRVARAAIDAIADDLAGLEDRVIGDIAVGTTPSVGLWVLPQTLAATTTDLPEVNLTVFEGQSDELVQRLLVDDLDLAITTGVSNPEIELVPLFDEAIVAVVATDHPLATTAEVSLVELASETLLLPLPDNPLHTHIRNSFHRAGLAVDALEVGSSALVSAMAAEYVGVALVPSTAIGAAGFTATRLPVRGRAPRRVALTRKAGVAPSRASSAVGDILARTARVAADSMPGCRVVTSPVERRRSRA